MAEKPPLTVTMLTGEPAIVARLGEILVATVAAGGSVSFMHPMPAADAEAFWRGALQAAERGERVVFGAWQHGRLVATVTLLLAFPPNQPHRAEIAKMMTAPDARGRGAATALMGAAEAEALRRGRTHLLLDTASEEGAGAFYERLGFRFCGEVPDFALKPHGGLTGTRFYWKPIGGG